MNPKKTERLYWRRTFFEFKFSNKKLDKFGKWRTVSAFYVPLEGEYGPNGKREDNLKLEAPEIIRLVPEAIHYEDKKPKYDEGKKKHVSFTIVSLIIYYL